MKLTDLATTGRHAAMPQFIQLEHSGSVAVLKLNRPPVNALDETALQQLATAIRKVKSDPAARAIIITSAIADIFCVGGDLKYWPRHYPRHPNRVSAAGRNVFAAIEHLPKPSIASINGRVIGDGLSLALACDIRIAAEEATFQLPEIDYGFIPGWGTIGRLVKAVGAALAAEILLAGEPIDAKRAQAIGLVNRLTPLDGLAAATQRLAANLATKPPRAMRYAKEALCAASSSPSPEQVDRETRCFEAVWGSREWEQGIEGLFGAAPALEENQ